MTSSSAHDDVVASLSAHDAAVVSEQALSAVLDAAVVRLLRPDSPLSAAGLAPADSVCLSDAVAEAAASLGWRCVLGDAELAGVRTVADLVDVVRAAATPDAATPDGDAPDGGRS